MSIHHNYKEQDKENSTNKRCHKHYDQKWKRDLKRCRIEDRFNRKQFYNINSLLEFVTLRTFRELFTKKN